jgi:hypothetical protein
MSDPKFTVPDTEVLLKDWDKKLSDATRNMGEMRMLEGYRLLTTNPRSSFTGRTAVEILPAIDALDQLWLNFTLLSDTVKKAHSLFDALPTFGRAEKLEEIHELLTGASIKLPAVQVPLAQRGLLTPAEYQQAITPARLLGVLLEAFQVAVKVVAQVDKIVNDHYQQLAVAQELVDNLTARATACRVELPLLASVKAKMVMASTNLNSDPLGVQAEFESEIPELLAQAEREIDRQEAEVAARRAAEAQLRRQLQAGLSAAQVELNDLIALQSQVDVSQGEVAERIANPEHKPRNPEILVRLAPQLQKLAANFAKELLKPVEIGLGNWNDLARQFRALEQAALANYRAMLEERLEIRGIFETAKVRADKYGLVEEPQLVALANRAKALLWRPALTPLAEARAVVEQYRGLLAPLISEKKAMQTGPSDKPA